MEQEFIVKIKLSREEAEKISKIQIPLEEWQGFWNCFKDYYKLEYINTLEWMGEEWEDIKEDYV